MTTLACWRTLVPQSALALAQTPLGGTMEGNSLAADAAMSAVFTTCTVDCETIGGVVAINIAGELDMADADRVGQILADAARTGTDLRL